MRDDYKIEGATADINAKIEVPVAEALRQMSEYTKLSESEIINTALKHFISRHHDFLPNYEF